MSNEVFAPTTASWSATGAGSGVAGLGIGTTMPTELANWAPYGDGVKPLNALVWWNKYYSSSLTAPCPKFAFIASVVRSAEVDTFIGFGLVANPSVSSTAGIKAGLAPGVQPNGWGTGQPCFLTKFYGSANGPLATIEDADAYGNGTMVGVNSSGAVTWQMLCDFADTDHPYTGILALWNAAGTLVDRIPAA
jgi:hypothetical protein